MRITYTEHVPDPKLRGTTTNLPAHIAQVLIASGQAITVPYKGYQEFLAAEHSTGSDPNNVDPNVVGTCWGVIDKDSSQFSIVRVIKRVGSETTYFKAPPTDAPLSIHQQFHELSRTEEGAARTAIEAAKAAQRVQQSAEKLGTLAVIWKGK
jgi:hypothetical protein